jgi:BMFP domain-containing protein YqiC
MLQEADNTKKDTSKTSEEWNKGTDNDLLIIDAAKTINENYERAVSNTDKENEEAIKNNNKNALAMLDLI